MTFYHMRVAPLSPRDLWLQSPCIVESGHAAPGSTINAPEDRVALPIHTWSAFMTDHPAPIDLLWTLVCAALVMLMQGGFCLLEAGFARAKNSINVAIKNLVDFCIASLLFWALGFGLMFGASASGLIGTTHFLPGAGASPGLLGFFFFQLVFCGTATTIISGAVAERIRFRGYLIIAALTSLLFYPVLGHWAWGGSFSPEGTGWLQRLGFIDFAGSTVVHSLGGLVVVGGRAGARSAIGTI